MDEIFNQLKGIKYPANIPQGERLGIPYDDIALEIKNKNKQARWKGAGMGEYYCSLCCETISGNRERYCPCCGAEMYTDKEWEKALERFKLEDEIYGV